MSLVRHFTQFAELHRTQHFSDKAHLLFNVLLGFINDRRTDGQLLQVEEFADSFLCMATGIKSLNTLKAARAELVQRRVLWFDGGRHGRGAMGKYKLLRYRPATDEETDLKLSKNDSLIDTLIDSFTADEANKLSEKQSTKLSNFDTNYQRVEGRENITTGGPRPEKKIGLAEAEKPDRGASHTGGGAAGVGTSIAPEGLRPLRDDEQARGGYIDERLPDSDPMKYVARPKNVEMVDEWLANNPNEKLRAKAGLGRLFFDYYEQFDWCTKGGTPIRNWQATARQFSFIDYSAGREAEQSTRAAKTAAASGGQLQQRSAGVEAARALFDAPAKGGQGGR